MEDIIKKCDLVIEELLKFHSDWLYLGPPITDDRLELLGQKINFILPFDFKYIFKKHNGLSLNGTEVYGLDTALRGSSLDEIYQTEHFLYDNPMPPHFFPFSPDGQGNHYCLDLSDIRKGYCPIVFWQHDFYYGDLEIVERCNDSFTDWIDDVMIQWTLDDYNYDGTDRIKQ